jgi:hypothetical protein
LRRIQLALGGVCLAAALLPGAAAAQRGDGFVPLFDGTLNGWVVENSTAGNFSVRDGLLRVEGPGGWLRSARQYGDAQIRLELRFLTDDADSGLFLRAPAEGVFARGWPNNSYQVQLRNPVTESRFPPIGGLFRHGMPPGSVTFDPALVAKVTRPTGEWQLVEVDAVADQIVVRLNGTEVLRAGEVAPGRGYIGLQGETGALEFRTVAVRERP